MYYSLISSMKKASANPLWNNIISYYTADNTPNDATGTANGTLVNGATYGTGKINNGFSLDGVNDYVETGTRIGFVGSQPHTYSAWIKMSTVKNCIIISNSDVSNGDSIGIGATNKLTLYKGNVNNQSNGTTVLIANTWYHVAISYSVYNGVSNNINMYINGSLEKSAIFFIGNSANAQIQKIGASISGTLIFAGLIDEPAVWNRELTATEITELYNSGSGKQYPL